MTDYIKTVVSICTCSVKVATQPQRLLSLTLALMPYLTVIGFFANFIIWNGGVVLGDKGNHVATLHLPQMLYIWPLFSFVSWPILYPYLATLPVVLFAKLPIIVSLESMLMFKRRPLLPRVWVVAAFVGLAAIAVHFNTIVHPFTLADNRHYTFYVFRMLMRPIWIKYAVSPVYVLCGWACIQALGARPVSNVPVVNGPVRTPNTPLANSSVSGARPISLPDGTNSARTSFVLIWLATTALQLVTAPLVEPRYCILPWIFWRIHVPLQQYRPAESRRARSRKSRLAAHDWRLWLETAWLLLVNAVTGYIFLTWEFEWPQEYGKLQRFMW